MVRSSGRLSGPGTPTRTGWKYCVEYRVAVYHLPFRFEPCKSFFLAYIDANRSVVHAYLRAIDRRVASSRLINEPLCSNRYAMSTRTRFLLFFTEWRITLFEKQRSVSRRRRRRVAWPNVISVSSYCAVRDTRPLLRRRVRETRVKQT